MYLSFLEPATITSVIVRQRTFNDSEISTYALCVRPRQDLVLDICMVLFVDVDLSPIAERLIFCCNARG
jgi:hypothetical protein